VSKLDPPRKDTTAFTQDPSRSKEPPLPLTIYLHDILGGRPFHPSVLSSIHPSSSSRKKKMMEGEEEDDEWWQQQQFIQTF
jgi:hypothetical protein